MFEPTLREIGKEMLTQDERGTANVLFAIEVDVKRYGHPDWCDQTERNENYEGEICEGCMKLEEKDCALPETCDLCPEAAFVWFRIERELHHDGNIFFTAKACDEHIRLNKHHYSNPKSFGISAWRNPEMEAVIKHLKDIGKV